MLGSVRRALVSIAVSQIGEPIDARRRLTSDRAALLGLLGELGGGAWGRPTACAGWSVHDVVVHVLGDDLGRLARSRDAWSPLAPWSDETIGRFVDRINDEWVVAARRLGPRLLIDLLRSTGEQLDEMWAARDPQAIADGVSWAGMSTGPVWFDASRDMTEYWVHEQQIRDAIGLRTRESADELAGVLDVFARGLPFALADVARLTGWAVRLVADLPGGTAIAWTIERSDTGWSLVPDEPGRAVVAWANIDGRTLWRHWTRQRGSIPMTSASGGDHVLVQTVLDHVAIIRSQP